MRARRALFTALVLALTAIAPLAHAAPIPLAQDAEEGNEGGEQGDAGTDTGEEAETGGADAETGAGEDEQAPPAEEEEGPQWTYQMSKITLAMLLLLFLAMGALYYRMIARRQRGV
jgi:hypothetical protein